MHVKRVMSHDVHAEDLIQINSFEALLHRVFVRELLAHRLFACDLGFHRVRKVVFLKDVFAGFSHRS